MSLGPLPPLDRPVAVFPLPNVVLFPGVTLPLQIFEPRYRAMIRDVLSEEGLLAMALLQAGYEPYYFTNLARLHPVVCVGRIREHVKLSDGRYFINLVGVCRARIREEDREGEYRTAMLEALPDGSMEVDVDGAYAVREQLAEALGSPALDGLDGIERVREWLCGMGGFGEFVDHTAGVVLPSNEVDLRQRLLEETDPLRRARALLVELRTLLRRIEARDRLQRKTPGQGSMN